MLKFSNAEEHLLAELERLELMLRRQVLRLRAANLLTEDSLRGLYISDAQVDALLSQINPEAAAPSLFLTRSLTAAIEQCSKEIEARVQISRAEKIDLPLCRLAKLFNLTAFELQILLIALAPELDTRYEVLYAYVQNDIAKKRPSVELALKLLSSSLAERMQGGKVFDSAGALVGQDLVQLVEDPQDCAPGLISSFLKVDRRMVNFVLGQEPLDQRLTPFTSLVETETLPSLDELILTDSLRHYLKQSIKLLVSRGGVLLFCGPGSVTKNSSAAAICGTLGRPLLVADLRLILQNGPELGIVLRLLRREVRLHQAGIYFAHFEDLLQEDETARRQLQLFFQVLTCPDFPLFLDSALNWWGANNWSETLYLSFEFPLPNFSQRLELWQQALQRQGVPLEANLELPSLANQFRLSDSQIAEAARQAGMQAALRAESLVAADLCKASYIQAGSGLRRLAQKVELRYGWADLILPPRPLQQLREVWAAVKYRQVVYTEWGFERKLAQGKGLNVLFSGASGTGKTMAAGIIAGELGQELYKIDLSTVVSKYIGETEKNLSLIFKEATASNAILFFDEADALFGKRSEVKDAHDRYANIEVAYLLQKMEEYEGIVILATNLSKNLDEAFARRMHHTIEFPLPDAPYRERMWRGLFPPQAPLSKEIDFGFLAQQFELTGGNIRNIGLAGALLAAEEGGAISMTHLIIATAREFQKLGRLPSQANFREYYELVRQRS